ncbi:MAG: signal peptidase I [Candidatus Melainabacteria bacterium HGW-Melainabacteria-1]|nr:MAG: signal peptidase I [Candidatus Melainabacteria bacterium HGW-Melainabacteria-1]
MSEDESPTNLDSGIDRADEVPAVKAKKSKSAWRETTETVIGALLIALITRGAVAEPRYIPSGSMLPTFEINDRLIIEKISNYTQDVSRGDVLVFYPPDEEPRARGAIDGTMRWLGLTGEEAYIKRVVGLPGETISVSDGKVLINGTPIVEPYILEAPAYDMAAVKIPAGHFFMMGDNRNNSADSHVWGPLPSSNVIGHASFRFWPPSRAGVVK